VKMFWKFQLFLGVPSQRRRFFSNKKKHFALKTSVWSTENWILASWIHSQNAGSNLKPGRSRNFTIKHL
jgi:hypothetical protein